LKRIRDYIMDNGLQNVVGNTVVILLVTLLLFLIYSLRQSQEVKKVSTSKQ